MIRKLKLAFGLMIAVLFPISLLPAQQSSIEDLKKEIQSLNETVKGMQKDLQEIKALLTSRAPAPPPQNVQLDLGNAPTRGERSAKLTLIEFTDYQ
jgi:hypothetical protein